MIITVKIMANILVRYILKAASCAINNITSVMIRVANLAHTNLLKECKTSLILSKPILKTHRLLVENENITAHNHDNAFENITFIPRTDKNVRNNL